MPAPHGWKMSAMAWDDERNGLAIPDRIAGAAATMALEI